MDRTQQIKALVESKKAKWTQLSDAIWATPELHFREYKSSRALADALEAEGFAITWGIGCETAFVASWGEGKPVISILGEFDALPGLSQTAGLNEQKPLEAGAPGHGCGHNALGTGSAAAAVAVKEYMQKHGLAGTIRFIGSPAEETGGGKIFMLRAGAFKDVDIAIAWHPGFVNGMLGCGLLSDRDVTFSFKGKAAHAAGSPHLGRSALDACELMNVGVNYLREHVIQEARIHYAYQDVGGPAPNVVQETASLRYFIRAPHVQQVLEISERVFDCARGAALMTGTEVTISPTGGFGDFIPNDVLSQVVGESLIEVGPPAFDEADYKLAESFFQNYGESNFESIKNDVFYYTDGMDPTPYLSQPLVTDIWPYVRKSITRPGGSDAGDVSYVVPTCWLSTACYANGTAGHSWQATAQTGTSLTHKGMLCAAEAMALGAVKLLEDPQLVEAAKAEHRRATGGMSAPELIPVSIRPEDLL